MKRLLLKVKLFICSFLGTAATDSPVQESASVQITFDRETTHSISSLIYGIGANIRQDHEADGVYDLNPSFVRFGGNITERFNWKIDAWNIGSDWYFTNSATQKRGYVDRLILEAGQHGAETAVTIPMLGWISKDDHSASFDFGKHPEQTSHDKSAGNGVLPNGKFLSANPGDTSISWTPADVREWVGHLKNKFGKNSHLYYIGNEPMLWHQTHRDVHPEPATYDEVLEKYISVATAVRTADPSAVIMGPALWGWLAMQQSAFDSPGVWSQGKKGEDRKRHGGKPFLAWFIEKVAEAEAKQKQSLIDVMDVHYYPANSLTRDESKASTPTGRKARMDATRSLWDSGYNDDSWIGERIQFLKSLKAIAATKKDLKTCIGEYNFYGEKDQSGGVALAELFGVFAQEQLYCAAYWTYPPKNSPAAAAFRLYRNYDGLGSHTGDLYIKNSVGSTPTLSAFSSFDIARKKLFVVLVNKSLTQSRDVTFKFRSKETSEPLQLIQLVDSSPGQLINRTMPTDNKAIVVPPLSATLVIASNIKIEAL